MGAKIMSDFNDFITFDGLSDFNGGFDKSSGTYTVPEDGIYIFGLQAKSGSQLASSRIDFYRNNAYVQAVVYEGNEKDYWNNLGTTWTDTLKKRRPSPFESGQRHRKSISCLVGISYLINKIQQKFVI